jgi:hypothetical protein
VAQSGINGAASTATCAAVDRLDDEIGRLAPELPDYAVFCARAAVAPCRLVAFGERRERFLDAGSLQKYAGVAPVTKRSGNNPSVHWRYRCPAFLHQTFIAAGGPTIPRFFGGQCIPDQRRSGM